MAILTLSRMRSLLWNIQIKKLKQKKTEEKPEPDVCIKKEPEEKREAKGKENKRELKREIEEKEDKKDVKKKDFKEKRGNSKRSYRSYAKKKKI